MAQQNSEKDINSMIVDKKIEEVFQTIRVYIDKLSLPSSVKVKLLDAMKVSQSTLAGKNVRTVLLGFPSTCKSTLSFYLQHNRVPTEDEHDKLRNGAQGIVREEVTSNGVTFNDVDGELLEDPNCSQLLKFLHKNTANIFIVTISAEQIFIPKKMQRLDFVVKTLFTETKREHSIPPYILFCVTKVDTLPGFKNFRTGGDKKFREKVMAEISKTEHLKNAVPSSDHIHLLSFMEHREWGLESFLEACQTVAPIVKMDHFNLGLKKQQEIIASRVITTFDTLNAAVSAILPFGTDVPVLIFLTDKMIEILSIFSTSASRRDITSFKNECKISFLALSSLRVGMQLISIPFDASVVFFPISMAVGGISSGLTTYAIGWKAFHYFTAP